MPTKSTHILHDTEAFMRGDLDNVTIEDGKIHLDMIVGSYVPYGCYTSPVLPMPFFDMLRISWNSDTPEGTVVEAQARVMVDGNWTGWFGFGKWSPYLMRESVRSIVRGPIKMTPDSLTLDSKYATQAQVRIYLYTKDEKLSPSVSLLACSVHPLDVIPSGGKPIYTKLHLMPYSVHRRAPALMPTMDLACSMASIINRWGYDMLPEEFALAMKDYVTPAEENAHNLCFAAAAAGSWGFDSWAGWADLSMLRHDLQGGYGVVVELESTQEQQKNGIPAKRYAALRGLASSDGGNVALLCDPWAAENDFDTETQMALDEFLVAWNNLALFIHPTKRKPAGAPKRQSIWLRSIGAKDPGLYMIMNKGKPAPLADDLCEKGGLLAWSVPDEHPHASIAHRRLHFTAPEKGGIRLERSGEAFQKHTVYVLSPSGSMQIGDVTF